MTRKRKHPHKELEQRDKTLSDLLDLGEITDADFRLLDTVARVEAGMLTFQEVFSEITAHGYTGKYLARK